MRKKIGESLWEYISVGLTVLGLILEWKYKDGQTRIYILMAWIVLEILIVIKIISSKRQIVRVYDMLYTMPEMQLENETFDAMTE